jgi:hypothetical protein
MRVRPLSPPAGGNDKGGLAAAGRRHKPGAGYTSLYDLRAPDRRTRCARRSAAVFGAGTLASVP